MSCAPQPTSTARPIGVHAGPLQVVLAAIAVCVLYWSVGINQTPAATSGSGAPAVLLHQVASPETVQSAVPVGFAVSGQVP
ncbi:MAG: hypothetical protein ABIQ13_01210 [Pedococcus sp.]